MPNGKKKVFYGLLSVAGPQSGSPYFSRSGCGGRCLVCQVTELRLNSWKGSSHRPFYPSSAGNDGYDDGGGGKTCKTRPKAENGRGDEAKHLGNLRLP